MYKMCFLFFNVKNTSLEQLITGGMLEAYFMLRFIKECNVSPVIRVNEQA